MAAAPPSNTLGSAVYHYTVLPNLYNKVNREPTPQSSTDTSEATFQLPTGVRERTVILSWAILIRGYTGSDRIVFEVNDEKTVSVDFGNDAVEDVAAHIKEETSKYTAIYFTQARREPPYKSMQLCLQADLRASSAYLTASGAVIPPKQLCNIARQFYHIVASLPTNPSSPVPPFPTELSPNLHHENPCISSLDGNNTATLELSILNPHPVKIPGPSLLHDLINFPSHGEKSAIDFLNADGTRTKISYESLHTLTDVFAGKLCRLLGRSAGRKTVPILLPQSCSLYVAQLSILKAGAAFVPLNLDAPKERIQFVVGDVDAGVIITSSEFSGRFDWPNAPEVIVYDDCLIEQGQHDPSEEPTVALPQSIPPSDPAYIMYTSGSTGKPKGVTISHSAATQSLLAHDKHIPQFRRFLQFAASTFDVSVFDTFFPLYRGCTLVGCDRGRLLANLPKVINELKIDAVELTPTVAGELLVEKKAVPGLKVLLTIGEMLTRHLVDEFGDGLLHGMYGPTEAAIHCTLSANFQKGAKVGDIGIPLDTVSAFVVAPQTAAQEKDVEVLPVGWVGELAVGGWQLADGYLNRPDLTNDAFVDTPRWGRLYRTGDRARILPSGSIECLGRVSSGQIKLRGQRVELGEIEGIVLMTPGVKSAVASVVGGSLVVYASAPNGPLDRDAVKEVCRQWLPGFMVPSNVVIYEDLPRLPSGKADRKRLDKDYSDIVHAQETVEEQEMSETEWIIARVAEGLLERLPTKDGSLVAMGLDSIQAIRLASRIRAKGLIVEVVDIVKSDTVAGIASAATTPQDAPSVESEIMETRFSAVREAGFMRISASLIGDVQDVIPCTSLQESMIAETARNATAYCNWVLLELPYTAQINEVETSLRALIQQNEILRTGFIVTDDGFAQLIWKSSRSHQFKMVESFKPYWRISLDDMLEPPFTTELIIDENNDKKLGFRIHHALYDGWSWENILSDFQTLLAGKQITAARPQYRDVVRWEFTRSPELTEFAKRFWRSNLEGAGETKLFSFHGHSDVEPGVSVQNICLSTSRSELESAARNSGVSSQVLIQTAWAYLLSSYVGKDDVVFGTVASGRTMPLDGIEDIVGPTILTLPIRVQVGLHSKIRGLIQEIHAFNRKLLERTELGLREIRKECGVDGLFDTLIAWQQTANERDGDAFRIIESKDNLEFSLLIEAEPVGSEVRLRSTSKDEIFPTNQVSVLLQQMDSLIQGIVLDPNRSVKALLTDLEVDDVLSIANPYPTPFPESSTRTLSTVFEDTTVNYPERIALEMTSDIHDGKAETEQITYSELNSSANKLARTLVQRNTLPDELVAICMEKSVLCYVSILAVVKAGAGYLPLTAETPIERIKQILQNSGVKILLSTHDIMQKIGAIEGVDIIDINTIDLSEFSDDNLGIKAPPKALAYAVFTSGSTGVPKGVLVEHKQAVGNLDVLAKLYPTAVGERMLQFCNIAFDVSVFEIFFAWHRGMVLCSATKDVLLRDMEAAVNAMAVTHLSMTPTVAALMKPDNVPNVKFLVTSGEAVTKKVFNDWAGRGLFQGYGPSETTNICTVNPRVRKTHDISNIGAPFKNTSAFVVTADEEELVLVPRGGVGELCFGGVQVCRGYLNMEELTARKFVTHPKFGRIYRSGDIGRLLPTDDIMFVGRQDDQVKIRGNRIELGEINAVLLRDRNPVIDSVTLVIKKGNNPQLVSFVVLNAHQGVEFNVVEVDAVRATVAMLFKNLAEFVPVYMVPNAIITVSTIPMTSQGKTDKRLLERTFLGLEREVLEKFSDGGITESEGVEWTDVERVVAGIVADIAHVNSESIGRSTSIFKLGLDSISAISLSSKLRSAGLRRLDVSQIMKNHTVSALARVLATEDQSHVISEQVGVAALAEFVASVRESVMEQLQYSEDHILKILPCTPLQEATLSTKKGADPRTYYNHTVLNLKIDYQRLHASWEAAAKAYDIMRTCFAVTSHHRHAFAQVVVKESQLQWKEYELDSEAEFATAIEAHICEVSAAMEITRPPYSFGMFISPAKSMLVMSFHHSLYDGFAMDLLLENVQHACTNADYKFAQTTTFDSYFQYMESLDVAKADDFWKNLLDGLESTTFPDLTGKSSAARKHLTGMASKRLTCTKELSAINDGCRRLSISLLTLGQSTWARLLSVFTGESDLCFGNVVSGRTIPVDGVDTIIAPCFNTVPLRVNISNGATTRAVMGVLQELNAEIIPFQLTPLRRIMTALKTEGRALFDTLFILQHASENKLEDLWEEIEDRGEMDFSIIVELVPSLNKDSLEIVMYFRRDIMLDDHIDVLLRQFDSTLLSALENTERPALDFSRFDSTLLSVANKKFVVFESADQGFLHSEFERNSSQFPDRIALEYLEEDGSATILTFGEINTRANKIANHLISLGVDRDEAIPLCIDKSPLFYICVLAVLKAGCAFTPVDPSLPSNRREFMIKELLAKMILVGSSGIEYDLDVKIINAQQILSQDSQISTSNPSVSDLAPQSLAYRIYTSGSTGLPKAVSIEHRNAVQTFQASKTLIRWNEDSRLLQFAATTFDMCYYDIFMAWSYGFTLCSAARKYLLGELEATINRLDISVLDLTPTVASTLNATQLPDVKLLYCIGEAMPQKLVSDWEGRCVNSYGPTEAAMCCTITEVSSDKKAAIIGKPFKTTSFAVLNKDGNTIIPVFGSGELCIGGSQVAREYHNNLELTKSRFISFHGDLLYKTGDIVRQLADGTFEFIGRTDDQVKIRGLRIELNEINTVLKESHEGVKEASTIVLKHSAGSKEQLVAFLALEGRKQHGSDPLIVTSRNDMVAAVRKSAQKILPRYMIPGVMLVVDHIPLSAAGKVDKKSLGAVFQMQGLESFSHADASGADELWTGREQDIRRVFSEISQVPVEQIHKSSTIYEIGLDSISASQVVSRLNRLGVKVSVIDILERPSIGLLSDLLSENSEQNETKKKFNFISEFEGRFLPLIKAEHNIDVESISGVFPCTAVQEGMLSQFLRSNGKLYFNHTLFKLPSNVNEQKLKAAWNSVFMVLDILRSGFVEVDDNVHSFAAVTYRRDHIQLPWLAVHDVSDLRNFVDKQKLHASSSTLEKLYLPPWQIVFFKTASKGSYLLFSGHHALYDATSLQIIFQDTVTHYLGSQTPKRPQFGAVLEDIVKHTLDQPTTVNDRDFWLKQLEGSSICRIPNLCPVRITSTTHHVKELYSSWNLSDIESACQRRGVSLHAVGQAAWARVLSAYTGETAVTLGVVFSGRTGLRHASGVVFPCLVTLPSLCVLSNKSNHNLALDIQGSNTRTLKHQHTPLKSIQRWFEHPEESFFDSIFIYQKTDGSGKEALLWNIAEEDASVDYTFSLEIEPASENRLLIHATARDNHVPVEQTDILIRQFDAALIDILENPDISSSELYNIPSKLLSITPAKVGEIPGDVALLHTFVERHRELCPDKVAFEFVTAIDGDKITKQTWTYAQLDAEGNKVANFLLKNGATTSRIVAISFEKCPEASFAILGILKAGCAYVAIDCSAPIDRKAFIIEDSSAFMVLTMDKYISELQGAVKIKVISAESESDIKTASSTTPVVNDLTPDNLSYCLYTSGTTGTPKGCELTHENAVQAMYAFQRLFSPHWDSESKFFQFASFHFDVSVLEQFWSWSVGVCVTSAPRDLIFQDIVGTINKLRITHLDLTPSLAALLRPEDVPILCRGVFITGGEALKQEILDTWGETGAIYNGYGPTEVTIGMTMYPRVPANGKPSNIGTQFDNVGTYVLAPGTDRPVPRGAIGELCAAGKLVGRGYLNRPELTKKAFPILEKFNEKIYRTGDLVRILYDGTFDFAGRADDQVKLRGQRLEIGEINQVVKKADASVEAVATLVLRHPKQQKDQLVSFIVVRSEPSNKRSNPAVLTETTHSRLISKLVAACRSKLPIYMVPTHFLPISHMPLSVNNKVDNKALKALYQDTSLEVLQHLAKHDEDTGEWSDVEQRLRSVLVDITKLEASKISRSSTIFELGLDSVSVVGLARRLKKSGFNAATPSLVMQNPALSQMASALMKKAGYVNEEFARLEASRQHIAALANKNSFTVTEILKLEAEDIQRILPCTSLQEGMIARFLNSETPLYFNSFPMVLDASTNIGKLHDAWRTVAQSVDMLRTCFCETPDGYAQVVLKRAPILWEEVNINNEGFQDEVRRGLARSISRNRNLHYPPVSILCISTPTRCILTLNIFHALYDGNSLPLVLNDVQRAYSGDFSPRPLQFGDVVTYLLSTDLKEAQKFWKETLSFSKPLQLGQLRSPLEGKTCDDYSEEMKLDFNSGELERLCKQLQCTPQSIFQAAWASVLAVYGGLTVTLGLVVSGRSLPIDNIEGVIGPTFNTIPGSFDVGGAVSWEALVKVIHKYNSESLPFHHTPLRLIHKWLRKTSEQPLFETLFAYQKDTTDGNDGKSTTLWKISPSTVVADYQLALEVAQGSSGEVTLKIVAKAELSREKVSDILHSVAANIQDMLENPKSKPLVQLATVAEIELTIGICRNSDTRDDDFVWGEQAVILRKTIAGLAEVEENDINADSSILELGLDSIEAIKLSSRLRQHDIRLSVSTIMRNTTIRKMQKAMNTGVQPAHHAGVGELTKFEHRVRQRLTGLDDVVAVYPTTPLQEAMVAETLASEYSLYFNHDVLELEPWIDLDRLRKAWETVVKNTDILRMSFVSLEDLEIGQTYAQIIHRSSDFHWNEVGVSAEDAIAPTIDAIMENTTKQADILGEPPVYVTLLKAPRSSHLILSISHALYDGWSIGLLHTDLRLAYFDSFTPRPSTRLLVENIVNNDAIESQRFWKHMLDGVVPSQFPTFESAQPNKTHRSERISTVSYSEVQAFCKKIGATVQSLGQTCWALLLAHYLGETDVVFGSVLSGRDFDQADEIMFPAMNTVPVRAILHGSYREMLSYMQENGSATLKYQHTPLRDIQKLVNIGSTRLFDTIFLYQRSQTSEGGEKKLYKSVGGSSDVEYNIAVEMERSGETITWRNACKSTVFNVDESDELLGNLDALLAHVVQNPEHPVLTHTQDGLIVGNTSVVRRQSQPVFNGVRIDLDGIAAAVNKQSGEIDGCAAIIANESGRSFIVLFVSGTQAATAVPTVITNAKRILPYWSLPSYVVNIDIIPLKGRGVDRERLQAIFGTLENKQQYAIESQQGEWTLTESQIRRILSKVSGLPEEEIQRTQTIFHLGLDSISAIRFSSDLRKEGIFLSVADILREATIERMAEAVAAQPMNGNATAEPSIDANTILRKVMGALDMAKCLSGISPDVVEAVYPATAGQLYMLDCRKKSNYKLFMPTITFKCSRAELSQIQYAWESLVHQEPILRTTFNETGNEETPFVQVVLKNAQSQFTWFETSQPMEDAFLRFIKSQEQQKKVSMLAPPVRLCAIITPTDTILFLTIHHALYDGVSLPLLLAKLQSLMARRPTATRRLPTPDPEGPKFVDYLALLHSQDFGKQREFWSSYLHGASSTLAITTTEGGNRKSIYRPSALAAHNLEARCRKEGISPHTVFLASFAKVLGKRISKEDEVVFGIYLANRNLPVPELSTMAAPTLNIVPLRVQGLWNTPSVDLARKIQEDLIAFGTPENATVDLRAIRRWTGVQVDCYFNFLKEGSGRGGKNVLMPEEINVDVEAGKQVVITPTATTSSWSLLHRFWKWPLGTLWKMLRFLSWFVRSRNAFPKEKNTTAAVESRTNLDIEVAVRDGMVDVGAFSSNGCMGEEELEMLVEEMIRVVEEI
ncbi:hypothetical protein BDD12DRAFT_882702 [Trichophaea hybrida]|nr:hypothetical protein BDD12DRAFT_882702 [Trichophaea hybrida]